MAKEKKEFNYGLYATITFIAVTAVLVLITAFTFRGKYLAFNAEKVAVNYADTLAQKGDGYNAYKYTFLSKSEKYGDFIRIQYMYPLIYKDYKIGEGTKGLDGLNDDKLKSDATKNDDGSLAGKLADTMYPYYVELINNVGWDNYDTFFKSYFNKLIEERKALFGDDYLDDSIMFSALEANVASYGDSLTGTKAVVDENSKVTLGKDTIGIYQKKFSKDYKLSCSVKSSEAIADLDAYKASLNPDVLATYGISANDISEAASTVIQVTAADGSVVAELTVTEAKIGNTWYVDNISTNTSAAYEISA